MQTENITARIPARRYENIPEELFCRHEKGEIQKTDYEIQTASWVADNTSKYPVRQIPNMLDNLSSYVSKRITGMSNRDERLSYVLGSWVNNVFNLKDQNDADLSLLIWCKDRCDQAGLKNQSQKLLDKIKLFENNTFPWVQFQDGISVQKRDSIEK